MKIILTRPCYKSHIITPPLGIGYLAAFLRHHGIDVDIIDGLKEALSIPALVERILAGNPDAVGISCLTAYVHECAELSLQLKAKGIRTIIGGIHPSFLPFQTLRDTHADFVICGEAENALLALLRADFNHAGIRGIYAAGDLSEEPEVVAQGEPVARLDSLPFPAWDLMEPASYPKAPHGAVVKNYPIGVITTSRGCPYACTFCASPGFYSRRIRFRSPENVVDEIELLVTKHGVREIHFEDDNLTLNREHAESICRLLLERRIAISWACPNGVRADKVDAKLLELMKQSGCYYLAFGIESANSEILEHIGKQEDLETIRKAIEMADHAGIACQGFFIFGLPGETAATIEETIRFSLSCRLSRAQFLILDVLPGSALWSSLSGSFTPKWDKNSYKEPEWLPAGLTREMLLKAQSRAFRRFYLRPSISLRLLRLLRPSQLFYILQRFMDYRILR